MPLFHKNNLANNFSEIVISLLKKYNYKTKSDPVIIQCFNPKELMKIRHDLNETYKLVQLLQKDEAPTEANELIDYVYWNSEDGLINYSTKEPSNLMIKAKELGLFIHPYTFRLDSLPDYVSSYEELLELFLIRLEVDGFFTDFPDIRLVKNSAACLVSYSTLTIISIFYTFIYLL